MQATGFFVVDILSVYTDIDDHLPPTWRPAIVHSFNKTKPLPQSASQPTTRYLLQQVREARLDEVEQ